MSRNGEFTNPNEETTAALILLELKHTVLDPQQSLALKQAICRDKHKTQFRLRENRRSLDLPVQSVRAVIGECSHPFEKQLTETDLKKDQMRLLLRQDHVKDYVFPMLSPLEFHRMENQGIRVSVYDFRGKIYEMIFKLWGKKAHVITSKNWVNFCVDHNLVKLEDWVTLRMFRHAETNQLCFLIVYERKALSSTASLPLPRKERRRSARKEEEMIRRRRKEELN